MRLNVKLKATFAGKFKLKKTNTITGEVEETGWFDNLILDQGLNLKGSEAWTTNLLNNISVGTGTTAPVNGNTAMETVVAMTNDPGSGGGTSNSGSSPWYMEEIVVKRFPTGTFSGQALSEIGIGPSATLFARALILDGVGTPTTITLGADDVLDATYILRQYRDGESDDNSLSFNSVTDGGGPVGHTGTIRAAWMDVPSGSGVVVPHTPIRLTLISLSVHEDATLGSITGQNPMGTGSGAPSKSEAAYGAGNFYRDFTGDWGLNNANFGNDITGLTVTCPLGLWQMVFTPAIQKDNTQVLDITIRLSWNRFTP